MMKNVAIDISGIQISPAKSASGLLAFASFLLNDQFFCGNIAIYPRTDGNIRLVYPDKVLPSGRIINIFHPVNRQVSFFVEEAVCKAYRTMEDSPHV